MPRISESAIESIKPEALNSNAIQQKDKFNVTLFVDVRMNQLNPWRSFGVELRIPGLKKRHTCRRVARSEV